MFWSMLCNCKACFCWWRMMETEEVQCSVFTWQVSQRLASALAVVLQYHGEKCLKIPGRRHKSYCSRRAAQCRIHKMSFKYSVFSNTGFWPSQKATPKTSEFPTRLRKCCFSGVSRLWDRCQRQCAARIAAPAAQVKHVAQLLAPLELQKQQESRSVPCPAEARHCQQGNQSATSRCFGNICSPNGILFTRLASNLEKNITTGCPTLIW